MRKMSEIPGRQRKITDQGRRRNQGIHYASSILASNLTPAPGDGIIEIIEEVGNQQYVQVGSGKLAPRHGFLTLGSGRNTLALEDIAYSLIANRLA
jgi:hypothetical protein